MLYLVSGLATISVRVHTKANTVTFKGEPGGEEEGGRQRERLTRRREREQRQIYIERKREKRVRMRK